MKLFNFLEFFFIISLAIMFVLVGLLMYHIRTQINVSEKRTDTLYEIVTNLSNELNAQKVHIANFRYLVTNADNLNLSHFQPAAPQVIKKIVVSDDGEDDSDTEYDGDEISETDLDVGADAAEEDIDEVLSPGVAAAAAEQENEIHVIKFPAAVAQDLEKYEVKEEVIPEQIEFDIDITQIDTDDDTAAAVAPAGAGQEDTESVSTFSEDLQKMNLPTLRKLAVQERGFSAHDVAKMKKAELLAMLV
jgi:hypothetical protein